MKIGIVSQWYPPEPWFIPAGLAEELASRGHEVKVLTGFPNYPTGRIYPGYHQNWRDVSTAGRLTVRRVPLYPSHDSSASRRAANYLSFAATSSAAAVRYLAGVDVVYVYHSPATVFAAPALLRLLYRIPMVLHIQDLWPESVTTSPMAPGGLSGRLMSRGLSIALRRMYRMAASIAVIAPSMRDLVVARGAAPRKVRTVLNWTDESLFHPVQPTEEARRAIGHRGRCTIMHAGNIGPFQDIAGAVRAAAAVRQIDLVLVGSGLEEPAVRRLADELGATNVRFVERRPPEAMAALYAAADYQLISLRDLPMFRGAIPSKLQAALACGRPVIAAAPGDTAAIVERQGLGLTCPPEDWRTLADRFGQAAKTPASERNEMADRALSYYRTAMSRRQGVDQMEAMLMAATVRQR